MYEEDLTAEPMETSWFIDLDWYQQYKRSFPSLARDCLCTKCYKRLHASENEIPANEIIETIKGCCANDPQYITGNLPILESAFRILIANGNQPMKMEDLSKQLSERRGGDTYHTSPRILYRLLTNDIYYGLRQAPG